MNLLLDSMLRRPSSISYVMPSRLRHAELQVEEPRGKKE